MNFLVPIRKETVSAELFLRISKTSHNIEKTRFIPPKIGGKGFGQFEITYKYPELKKK